MKILIDQRIELITIIQTLCDYWDNLSQKFYKKGLLKSKYKDNVIEYFGKYKKHETILLYENICNNVPCISSFLDLVLHHSKPPKLNKIIDYKENIPIDFIKSMKIFYNDTNFKYFFEENKSEYKKIIIDYGDKNKILNELKNTFEYLDINNTKNISIIISPLVLGNFGLKLETENYIIVSPNDYVDNKYIFGSMASKIVILRHEIGHTVINDLTDKYKKYIEIKDIEIADIDKIYNNIETIINEYIIRSIVFMLEEDRNAANSILENETKCGFGKIGKIKKYIHENCSRNKKLLKDDSYINLIKYVLEVISKSNCA